MSRISFKDMFKTLLPQEQQEFIKYVQEHYKNFDCKGYEFLKLEDDIRPFNRAIEDAKKI